MPTTPSANEATFQRFFEASGTGKWGEALDCVSRDFRGTISRTQTNLSFKQYKEEMQRVQNALQVTQVPKPVLTVHGSKITAVYTVHATFAHDLHPRRGSRAQQPLKANNKPVKFDVRDVYTFNSGGEIVSIVSESLAEKIIAQMTA